MSLFAGRLEGRLATGLAASALALALLAETGRAQRVVVRPRVFNDVPGSQLNATATDAHVTLSDQKVSAPGGWANRHDWRVSRDGMSDRSFGPTDYFDLSADVTLTGSPTAPRKEAGLRINSPCGDSLLMVNTDSHEVVAFGGAFPHYDFRSNGAPPYQTGDSVRMRIRYMRQGGVNGFILTVGAVTSPFLPAQGPGSLCSSSTVGGYLQVLNAPAIPDNGGAAVFSGITFEAGGSEPPPALTDEQLLDRTEAQACAYASTFRIVTAPTEEFPNGRMMVADTSRSGNLSSVAATGMGLVCYAVQASRYGSSPEWTVTPEQARAWTNAVLDTVLEMQGDPAASWNGVPYHFVAPNAEGRFVRAPISEVSSVDGALLVAGALAAGQSFGGEVREKALRIASAIRWSEFLVTIGGAPRFSMAWKPEAAETFTIPRGRGYLTITNWDRPTDEVLVIGILALGTEPGNLDLLRAMYSWPRTTRTYFGGDGAAYHVVNSYFGSLFTYTQLHALVPFDLLGKDHPEDVGATGPGVDWWANSVAAVMASRQFSMDHAPGQTPPDGYPTHAAFGPDSWGLTAAFNPANLGEYKGDLGAPPRESRGGAPEPDGIIAPYGAISALRLMRASTTEALSDNPAFRALRHYYETRYDTLWGPYGPQEAFDDAGNVASLYVGIDTGLEAMAIEDYRTGATHRWFTSNPIVAEGLRALLHASPVPGDVTLDGVVNLEDVRAVLRRAAGMTATYPAEVRAGDLDADARLSMFDAVALVRQGAGTRE